MRTLVNSLPSSNRFNLAVLALLLVLALSLSFTSAGRTRGGDDEGSGIGGTGRMAVPRGESGLGGTGFKPYLGLNSDAQLQIQGEVFASPSANTDTEFSAELPPVTAALGPMPEPEQRVARPARPALVDVAFNPAPSSNRSEIDISEKIQRDIEVNSLYFEQLHKHMKGGASEGSSDIASSAPIPPATQAAAPSAEAAPGNELASLTEDTSATVASHASDNQANTEQSTQQVTWNRVADYLATHVDTQIVSTSQTNQDASDPTADSRNARPDRLQRPELPPVQRVRPIQRAAILPPRVKPLQL